MGSTDSWLRALIGVALLLASTHVTAGYVEIPADVSMHLSADPDQDLVTGQPITFTLAVTNHGPEPVSVLVASSSPFTNEFVLSSGTTDCKDLGLVVVDGQSFYYYYDWVPTSTGPLAVGETRSCHVTLSLSAQAPDTWTFYFSIPVFYVDLDPSNNSSSVTLRRGSPTAHAVPALSPLMLFLLALLTATSGAMAAAGSQVVASLARIHGKPPG
ncbi:MAG: hypothetical protein EYC71_08850 [Gammaproteobacteria bacterium]|nr:MAG: hypothetical protein EYC71_08850 [Gammaproteobacteria bacterium]